MPVSVPPSGAARTAPRRPMGPGRRLARLLLAVIDPRPWLHVLRIVNFYNYSHVQQRRRLTVGADVRLAPNVSFRNAERIQIADGTQIGEHCSLWAGEHSGRIDIEANALLAPDVFITASNYSLGDRAVAVVDAPKAEQDVRIGEATWLGRGVTVLPGVSIGAGAIVAAGAVVTRDVAAWSIVGGVPAREIGRR